MCGCRAETLNLATCFSPLAGGSAGAATWVVGVFASFASFCMVSSLSYLPDASFDTLILGLLPVVTVSGFWAKGRRETGKAFQNPQSVQKCLGGSDACM